MVEKAWQSLEITKRSIKESDKGAKDALSALLLITAVSNDGPDKRKVEALMREDNTLMRGGFPDIWSLISAGLRVAKKGLEIMVLLLADTGSDSPSVKN